MIRKDNVRAIESSETARHSEAEQNCYFEDAKARFVKLVGGPKNLLNATIRTDEHNARHLNMFVMPIDATKDKLRGKEQEKLNCKR